MMSMMCEDLFCSRLGLTADDTPLSRLPLFCGNWHTAGLEYRDGSGMQMLMSYAYPFALGDWLMRNFGGRSVVSAMSQNLLYGAESIERATGRSMEELLVLFAASCAVPDSASLGGCGGCSFGNSPDDLKDVDLWSLAGQLPSTYDYARTKDAYRFTGPRILRYDSCTGMRPYGVKACYIGMSDGGDISMTMGSVSACPEMKMYVLVSSSAPAEN
jgi:hypothetical protein